MKHLLLALVLALLLVGDLGGHQAAGTLGNSNLSPAGAAANAEWQWSLHTDVGRDAAGAYIGAAVTATPDRIVHAHPNMWPNPEGWPR